MLGPLVNTISKLTMFMTLSDNDFGGVNSGSGKVDQSVCSICGTTSICMPYVSSKEEGLKKFTFKEKSLSRGPNECGCAYCYYCVKCLIQEADDDAKFIPCPKCKKHIYFQ